MAGSPKDMIENPDGAEAPGLADGDALSNVLRTIRLSGSLQFCFMPTGAWQTDAVPRWRKLTRAPEHDGALSYPRRGNVLAEDGGA